MMVSIRSQQSAIRMAESYSIKINHLLIHGLQHLNTGVRPAKPVTTKGITMNYLDLQTKDIPDNKDAAIIRRYNNYINAVEQAARELRILRADYSQQHSTAKYERLENATEDRLFRQRVKLNDLIEKYGETLAKY